MSASEEPDEIRKRLRLLAGYAPVSTRHETTNVMTQFRNESGESLGSPLHLPVDVTPTQLQALLNELRRAAAAETGDDDDHDDDEKFAFFVNEVEVDGSLEDAIAKHSLSTEATIDIVYQVQAVFRVRSVTRCTASLPGHAEAVLSAQFSPSGSDLASGSGDTTVRFWDMTTQTPRTVCKAHKSWVLFIAWSPDGKLLASGDKNCQIFVWNPESTTPVCGPLTGHRSWINCISWEPLHLTEGTSQRFASASKDNTIKIWDIRRKICVMTLGGHTSSVAALRWGGEGLIYSGSHDRTVKVWRASDGALCRSLDGHAHWVNTLALSTDYALRTGPFDHTGTAQGDVVALARTRYEAARGDGERLVSGSDDFTMFLWRPSEDKKPVTRMTGHQQLVAHICYSPDGRIVASGSFDKSVRLWDGRTGKFMAVLRGHVGAIYQVCWSADSRLLVSGSKDSTMKVWDVKHKALKNNLPGHADEVYTVDWSPNGESVVSGSKDKLLRIWRM